MTVERDSRANAGDQRRSEVFEQGNYAREEQMLFYKQSLIVKQSQRTRIKDILT